MFHIADFPAMFAAPILGASQITLERFDALSFSVSTSGKSPSHSQMRGIHLSV
jgi:hypothetical protein